MVERLLPFQKVAHRRRDRGTLHGLPIIDLKQDGEGHMIENQGTEMMTLYLLGVIEVFSEEEVIPAHPSKYYFNGQRKSGKGSFGVETCLQDNEKVEIQLDNEGHSKKLRIDAVQPKEIGKNKMKEDAP
ncbi:hypothetical protein AMTR_s00006p00204850 [Amborella trichopoda]|uniref:Uncharacterized protein n=1 Tax=Amborella trichopoda TaxID=13333 RepID=W1PDD3_AMBTC|nr:hypothetical protein AMTR_s00006p00204850 [Amborella trichopoda]